MAADSGEWRDDSTFVVRLIAATEIVPSVKGLVPFSTRPADLRVSTAGGAGLPGALIQNRGVSEDRTASSAVAPADPSARSDHRDELSC